jgi:hypothetical protein
MPLLSGKSKSAMSHNIKAEMHAGKPQKQALAIAYSMARRGKKKMANGGPVEDPSDLVQPHHDDEHRASGDNDEVRESKKRDGVGGLNQDAMQPDLNRFKGGEVSDENPASSIAEMSMDEREDEHEEDTYYSGGEVDPTYQRDELEHIRDSKDDDLGLPDNEDNYYSEGGPIERIMARRSMEGSDPYQDSLEHPEQSEDNDESLLQHLMGSDDDETNMSLVERALARRKRK